MSSVYKTSEKIIKEAEILRKRTQVSLGQCIIFLKIAYERFKDLSVSDLVVAADQYIEYLKKRTRPSNINLIQAQLFSLMLAYL